MSKQKLPSIKSVLASPSGSGLPVPGAPGQLPSLQSVLGDQSGQLPSLKDVLAGTDTLKTAPKKHGGGGLLGVLGDVGHALGNAAHYTGGKLELAGHDLRSMPGGVIEAAKVMNTPEQAVADLVTLHPKQAVRDLKKGGREYGRMAKGQAVSAAQSLRHPLRDPFQTLVTVAPLLHGFGSAAVRTGEASSALKAGEGVKGAVTAATKKPELKPRLIRSGEAQVPLHASKNPAVRAVQGLYDRVIQHALDTNPEGKIAAHANRRIGGSIAETARYQQRMREAPASMVEQGGRSLGPLRYSPRRVVSAKVPRRLQEAALRLTSENSTAEEAAAAHRQFADEGLTLQHQAELGRDLTDEEKALAAAVKDNQRQAKLYDAVAARKLVTRNEHGDAVINAADYPHLAEVDAQVAAGQDQVDQIAKDHGLMTAEGLRARRNGPARIRNGAVYEKPTAAKQGVETAGLKRARQRVASLQRRYDTELARAREKAGPQPMVHTRSGLVKQNLATAPEAAFKRQHLEVPAGPKTPGVPSVLPVTGSYTERLKRIGGALSIAKDELQRQEAAAAARVKPTGIVGGEGAREGRGFVTYRTSEPKASKTQVSATPGPVIGKVRSFIPKKAFTGEGLRHGKVPDNTTRLVADHMRHAYRFLNNTLFRDLAAKTGSATKRSSRDVLVLKPGETPGKLTTEMKQAVGREQSTVDTLPDETPEVSGLQQYVQHLVPGLADGFARERAQAIGTQAPDGYMWVDRGVLGDLAKPSAYAPKGRVARGFDNVNSAVTAATVYFKLGHIGTRVLTNAATNIIQGSATPTQIAHSVKLWDELTPLERQKALAAAGQHGYQAMPVGDGTGRITRSVGRAAKAGTNWWAKHADAPFRFNSIAYEARKAGFDTPAKFRDLLDKLENPHDHNMNAAEAAKVDWVAKRANREGIAYDRLNATERNYITKAFWFYPWTAGATRFAVNTLLEHPYKTALLGNAGVQGRKTQARELGDLPTYEQGLFQIAASKTGHPLVADFSTFSPFATPAELLQLPRSGEAADFLNPGYAALLQLATRTNQYGEHTNNPVGAAVSSLFQPTPEAQILSAYLARHQNQSRRMFHKTPLNTLARAAAGPGLPRRINVAAAHSSAARERSGR